MIHFQGAVFWVSSSMQLIIKLLRPGRIIPAFFFFLPRIRVKLYFEGGSSSMHLLAGFVLRGLESEKGPIWAGQNRLLESSQSHTWEPMSPASFRTSHPHGPQLGGSSHDRQSFWNRYTALRAQKEEKCEMTAELFFTVTWSCTKTYSMDN